MARILTPERAARAIYFDFEGCADEAPSLLGWSLARDDGTEHFTQDIVSPALTGATRKVPHTAGKVTCGASTLRTAVDVMVLLAEQEDRRIVSWARFDMDVIERYVDDPAVVERARARYMNALPTARQWLQRVRPDEDLERTRSGKHRLAAYCALMGIAVPQKYGANVAARGIRAMRDALCKHGSYAKVPIDCPARQAWKAVLGHNRLDCRNAWEVVNRAAQEYAAV